MRDSFFNNSRFFLPSKNFRLFGANKYLLYLALTQGLFGRGLVNNENDPGNLANKFSLLRRVGEKRNTLGLYLKNAYLCEKR